MFNIPKTLSLVLLLCAINAYSSPCKLTSDCTDSNLVCDIYNDTCLNILSQPCNNSDDCVNNLICAQNKTCQCQVI